MAVRWLDPGGAATGGTQLLANISGAVTAQTSVIDDQPYAYQFNTSSPAANASARVSNVTNLMTAAGGRMSDRFSCSALPATNTSMAPVALQGASEALAVYVGSDGLLRLYTSTGATLLKTGATALSANTWYRISLCYTITTTTNWSAKVYIDGVLEFTATNADGTLSTATTGDFRARNNLAAGTNVSMYLSSLYVDDTADQTDPGNVRVTAKLPTTTTTNNFDTTVGTGAVNERPVNTANGRQHAGTTDVDQDYEIQNAATGDANLTGATIVESMAWIWANLSSLTGTPLTKMIYNGARGIGWDSTSASTTVGQLFTSIIGSGSAYPQNANGKNIGSSSSVIAADTYLFDCGVVVAYIPAAAAATKAPPPFQRPWRRFQRRTIA